MMQYYNTPLSHFHIIENPGGTNDDAIPKRVTFWWNTHTHTCTQASHLLCQHKPQKLLNKHFSLCAAAAVAISYLWVTESWRIEWLGELVTPLFHSSCIQCCQPAIQWTDIQSPKHTHTQTMNVKWHAKELKFSIRHSWQDNDCFAFA